jgi:two-component system nitrate/nitrite sensor histidine kinase NarX
MGVVPDLYLTISIGILLIGALGYLIYLQRRASQRIANMQKRLSEAEELQARTTEQLQSVLQVSQKFIEAGDESEIIETVLQLAMKYTGAMGASFVALDERSQPVSALRKGVFPFPIPDAWLEYLASTAVREGCKQCSILENHDHTCALLTGPFSEAMGILCFPVRYGEDDLGMVNLYMPGSAPLSEQERAFLRSLVDATALAMESDRLRQRELATLSQLRTVRSKSDLKESLANLVQNLYETVAADITFLILLSQIVTKDGSRINENLSIDENAVISGDLGGEKDAFEALVQMVMSEKETLTSEAASVSIPSVLSWIAVPLFSQPEKVLGVLVVASRRVDHIPHRHTVLVQGVAEQMSLLVQNTLQMADLEYKIMMDERTRLAREIHDGLAQTLGFLKLQVAQMLSYMERGDEERLEKAIHLSYETLASAYNDARQAIDGLRVHLIDGEDNRLESWLRQTIDEISSVLGPNMFAITLEDIDVKTALPPEVHAQLIRIVQEALFNVRKHANARRAWVSCVQMNNDLILEIRDDGQGFTVSDTHGLSRYGLKGMRERAELIGADFQVISCPGEGTTVKVRLPLQVSKRLEVKP